mmetsp:Transcript_87007/g.251310  ORF Transcript_87007/g.251310 Transcript_87007/m.251310 type:complete len:160 (+) Transcript_87007:378-857(+)
MSGKKRGASSSGASKASKKIKVGAVRIKEEPAQASGANVAGDLKEVVKNRFIALLSEPKHKDGISNKDIQATFTGAQERTHLANVINDLSRESRLRMSKSGVDNQLYYTLVAQDVAKKYQGLDVAAKMVLQVIEKAGNQGIWTKDIRMQTNIQQQALNG